MEYKCVEFVEELMYGPSAQAAVEPLGRWHDLPGGAMEKRVRAAIGAILWATMVGWAAAQTGIPKSTQLNPGHVTLGAGNFIVIAA